ncbi:cyclase family protein [Pseudomonas fragi]|nr:cyclase family protein [Pseudomonas fragi]
MCTFGSTEPEQDFEPFKTKDGNGYNGTGRKSPQWWPSRYGADDRIGSGNELTPERTLEAVRLVSEGRVIELTQILEKGVPIWPPAGVKPEFEGARPFHQTIVAHAQLEATVPQGNHLGYFEENVFKTYHIGTHIDGLAHIGIDGRYYNGIHYKDFYTPTGVKTLGMESTRPFVCRGVILNIAKLLGVEMLTEGFVITPEHLEAACAVQNVEVKAGDAVIIHTGYGALWMVDNDRYGNLEPGIGWDAAHWLTDRHISAVGADTWSVEVLPGERLEAPFVIHQHLLAETGTHIIENMKTDELAACGKSEFLFICLPIKHRGATGSQISPVAVI